ncbi:MAG: hypothetical protein M0Z78_09010 [Betaproteobacteria bacterium]|nr:hypothetical protein [Betaproteobacteria bacterium]
MIDQPNNVDIHTKENRIVLTKMVMRLFGMWEIPISDQGALLNRSLSTIRRYRNGRCFADDKDMLDRVGNLEGATEKAFQVLPKTILCVR